MTNKRIAFIPARSGSKRFPGKNKYILQGKPLFMHTVESSVKSGEFNDIIVSSDDSYIIEYCIKNNIKIHHRPNNLGGDNITNAQVITAYLNEEGKYNDSDILCLLQPTSPLRTHLHISEAFNLFFKYPNGNSLISVIKTKTKARNMFFYNANQNKYNLIHDTNFDDQVLLMPNGAIYICKIGVFLQNQSFVTDHTILYKMNDTESIDIDYPEDIKIVSCLKKEINE